MMVTFNNAYSNLVQYLSLPLYVLFFSVLPMSTSASDLDMLISGQANAHQPNIVFLVDGSGSMSQPITAQRNYGIPNPGDDLKPTKSVVPGSIEIYLEAADRSQYPISASDLTWASSFFVNPLNAAAARQGPIDPSEMTHLQNFLNHMDSTLRYVGNITEAGFTPQPWTQMYSSVKDLTKRKVVFAVTSSFGLQPSVTTPQPAVKLGARYTEVGIPREDFIKDMIVESMYSSHMAGGANVAVMFTLPNSNGSFGNNRPNNVRFNPPRDPVIYHDRNDNGAFVMQHFGSTQTLADTHAKVQDLRPKTRPSDNGMSPLLEAIYSARLYFGGETSPWDKNGLNKASWLTDPRIMADWPRFMASIDTNAYVGGNISGAYESIWDTNPCGENHIIMYSDAVATSDYHANSYIISEMGAALDPTDVPYYTPSSPAWINFNPWFNQRFDTDLSMTLLDEYIRYIYETDLDTTKSGKQNITTHLIDFETRWKDPLGFGTLTAELEGAIFEGGGEYHFAEDVEETRDAFQAILSGIMTSQLTGYRVNIPSASGNALEQGDYVYVSFFDSIEGWQGNLKKFRLDGTTVVNSSGAPVFDSDGKINKIAVAEDYWSSGNSSDPIHTGGISGKFDHTSTKRYVQNSSNLFLINPSAGTVPGLSLTPANFGVAPGPSITDLIKMTGGVDVLDHDSDGSVTDSFTRFGDALRTKPRVFYYHRDTTTPTNSEGSIFISNNYGYVHSFDLDSGEENWAVIPDTYLPAVGAVYTNDSTKQYGLDGGLTYYHEDLNGDFDLLDGAGNLDQGPLGNDEKLFLYSTSRRGGDLVTALDISDPQAPRHAWQITAASPGFSRLGQTWSTPTVARVQKGPRANDTSKAVLFFGGGYNPAYDDPSITSSLGVPAATRNVGASVYMVDPETGTKLWSGDGSSISGMNFPVVSEIKTLDADSDGLVDLFYVLDLMGQIFRCDIDDLPDSVSASAIPGSGNINCRRIVKLDSTKTRRFYAGLDAVLTIDANGRFTSTALAVGSGNINTPDAVTSAAAGNLDRFYTVFDPAPQNRPSVYLNATEADLVDATAGGVGTIPTGKSGWYIELMPSEKVLTASQTVLFRGLFQTYFPNTPVAPTPNVCEEKSKYSGRTFLFDIRDAGTVTSGSGADPRAVTNLQFSGLPNTGTLLIDRIGDRIQLTEFPSGITLPTLPAILKTYYSDEEALSSP